MKSRLKMSAGSGQLWPILLLLAVVVILPTVCLLWFMSQAVKNVQAAARQILVDEYQERAEKLGEELDGLWSDTLEMVEDQIHHGPAVSFDILANDSEFEADGCVIYDEEGNLAYPIVESQSPEVDEPTDDFDRAWQLEFARGKLPEAAAVYEQIADSAEGEAAFHRAMIGKIRCLGKLGEKVEAAELCYELAYRHRTDELESDGLTRVLNAKLLLVSLYKDLRHTDFHKELGSLLAKLSMSAPQAPIPSDARMFFLSRVVELAESSRFVDKGSSGPVVYEDRPGSHLWLLGSSVPQENQTCDVKFSISGNTVEFRDVSLLPGIRSNVQVELEGGGQTVAPIPIPQDGLYEKAIGSKNLQIKVGPTTFAVDRVVRWDRNGYPVFEDGRGAMLDQPNLVPPDYTREAPWMDVVNIYMSPSPQLYDVLELRVFDHYTREPLQAEDGFCVGYDFDSSIVQLRSLGRLLPETVDVWFRILHNPPKTKVWQVKAQAGASGRLDDGSISVREIRAGQWSYRISTVKGKVAQVQWTEQSDRPVNGTSTVVFDFKNMTQHGNRYQICAVGVDGERYVPDYPHFIGLQGSTGGTTIVVFDLSPEQISHFELRPFHGRDTFFFEGLRLPVVRGDRLSEPPAITIPVDGSEGEFVCHALNPVIVRIQTIRGVGATGISGGSGTRSGHVHLTPEPRLDVSAKTTITYDVQGLSVKTCSVSLLDDQGRAIATGKSRSSGFASGPPSQTIGFEVLEARLDSIGQIQLTFSRHESNKGRIEHRQERRAREFEATLPNGNTIELVGICDYLNGDSRWWRPDGTAMKEAPPGGGFDLGLVDEPGRLVRVFAIAIGGLPQKALPAKLVCEIGARYDTEGYVARARAILEAEELSSGAARLFPTVDSLRTWSGQSIRRLDLPEPVYGIYDGIDDKTVLVLMKQKTLISHLADYVNDMQDSSVVCRMQDNLGRSILGKDNPVGKPFLAISPSKYLADWDLELYFADADVFEKAARRQQAIYVWAGVLVIVLILATGGFAGRALGRQMRLNRLKNDFIATVSHELKTPLASMRVLVDTLLEGRYKGEQQAIEYLQLVSQENERLSNLIDNFLTFSRMERNKQAFEMSETAPAAIANRAAEAVRTKFEQVRCRFDMSIDDNLPEVLADQDAMVTALVNLLDNACKYSQDEKQIMLRVFTEVDLVCFAVSDKGVGMSRRALKKIFDRFHQVDRSLARRAQGCGLGLSIVKFIVDAHKGIITVDSKPGKGSIFTIRLPAVD